MKEYILLVARVCPLFDQTVKGVIIGTIKQIGYKSVLPQESSNPMAPTLSVPVQEDDTEYKASLSEK